jgi:hypothetical protein
MPGSISTSAVLGELQSLADSFGVAVDVRTVPSIQDWCRDSGLSEDNPFLCGKALWDAEAQRHIVLLADPITSEMRSSVLAGMEMRGRIAGPEISLLKDRRTFVNHLLLHEMAHVLDHEREEVECDVWAFNQLRSGT